LIAKYDKLHLQPIKNALKHFSPGLKCSAMKKEDVSTLLSSILEQQAPVPPPPPPPTTTPTITPSVMEKPPKKRQIVSKSPLKRGRPLNDRVEGAPKP